MLRAQCGDQHVSGLGASGVLAKNRGAKWELEISLPTSLLVIIFVFWAWQLSTFGCSWSLERFRWDMVGERFDFPGPSAIAKKQQQRPFQPFQPHLCSGIRQPFATVNTPDAHWRQGPRSAIRSYFLVGNSANHKKVVIENSGQSQSPPCNRDDSRYPFPTILYYSRSWKWFECKN